MLKKQVLSFDFWLEALWLLMIAFLPLVFFPNLFTTFELAKVTLMKGVSLLLFLLWTLKTLLTGRFPAAGAVHKKPYPCVAIAQYGLLIFVAFSFLATLVSVAPALSFFGWYPRFQGIYTEFFYVLLGVVIYYELRTDSQKTRLVLALGAGMIVACVLALLQKFLPGFLQWWNDADFQGRVYGTLANPNYLATYLLMVLPIFLVKVLEGKLKLFSIIASVLGLVTLLFTLSRSGLLACTVVFVTIFGLFAVRKRAWKMLVAVLLLPLLGGLFVWYAAANPKTPWVQQVPFMKRIVANEESASSARTRILMWPAVLQQVLASPVIGYGPGTFAVTFASFAPPDINTREDQGEIPDHAHNELLDMAVETGIPGMIGYFAFLFGIVGFCLRSFLANRGQEPSGRQWLLLGLGTGILGLFVANAFGFSVTIHWVYLAFFSAIIFGTMDHHEEFHNAHIELSIFAKILIGLLLFLPSTGMFYLHDLQKMFADAHMRQGYDAIAFADFSSTAAEYKSAMELAPVEPFYAVNYSYLQLQRMYEEQDLSAIEIRDAYAAALHGARLRGYDSFPVSIALEIKKISGLTF